MKVSGFGRIVLFVYCFCFSYGAQAQFREVEIGVNGLTCSQCTRSVEMHIRKLSFVKNVEMNLEHTNGKIVFKDQQKVDLDKIAQAVNDAGFSVRNLEAKFSFDHFKISPEHCFNYQGDVYQFVKTPQKELNGEVSIKFIGEKFLSKKDFKKWGPGLKPNCNNNTGKTYYVTM